MGKGQESVTLLLASRRKERQASKGREEESGRETEVEKSYPLETG